MNTALNFVSLPKDTASSVAAGEVSAENRTASVSDPAGKRQDFADGGEKTASFAKVLKDETRQEPAQAESRNGSKTAQSADKSETVTAETKESRGTVTETAAKASTDGGVDSELPKTENRIQITSASVEESPGESAEDDTENSHAELSGEARSGAVATDSDKPIVAAARKGSQGESENSETETTDSEQTDLKTGEAGVTVANPPADPKNESPVQSAATKDVPQRGQTSDPGGSDQGNTASATIAQSSVKTESGFTVERASTVSTGTATSKEFAVENTTATVTQALKNDETTNEKVASPEHSNTQAKPATVSVSASLESFPAAGKELPTSGNNLPAGLFFQAQGETPVISRGEQSAQTTQPIDLNSALTAKQGPVSLENVEKDIEMAGGKLFRGTVADRASQQAPAQFANQDAISKTDFTANPAASSGAADKMLRSIMNSQNLTLSADISTPATAAATTPDSAGLSPALPNALLQLGTEKSFLATKSILPSSGEPALNLNITSQAGSAEWQNQLSSRIRWMGDIKLSSAELKLHPAELGAVEIQISTEDDQTRVSFITSNAAAKEIIESSMPRLRELLGEGGLQLEQGDVAHRDLPEDKQAQELAGTARITSDEGEENEPNQATLHFTRKSTSQIDHYV